MTHSGNSTSAEPNLTPILDMVFQLITFFMLVISFKTATMDPNVRLPVLGSAQPSNPEAERDFIVLNIDAVGDLHVYGAKTNLEQYLVDEVANLQAKDKPAESSSQEPFHAAAVIRADRNTSFTHLQRVLTACKKHGFRDVTLKVMDADETAQVASSATEANTARR